MIKNKKLGLKIAENDEERIWESTRKATEERIRGYKDMLIIEEAILKLAEEKLKCMDKKAKSPTGVG